MNSRIDVSEEQALEEKLRVINDSIQTTDEKGIYARWKFGKEVVVYRQGKKLLPRGLLRKIFANVGVETNEVQRRIRLATQFSTEDELRHAVTQFKNWHQIVNKALPLKSLRIRHKNKKKKRNDSELRIALLHLVRMIRNQRKENADVKTNWRPEASSKFKMIRLLDQIERELDDLINDVATLNDTVETG